MAEVPAPAEVNQEAFEYLEENHGIRLSWSAIPATDQQAKRLVVPIGSMYTPLRVQCEPVVGEPRVCRGSCGSILNPYCIVDRNSNKWFCSICSYDNPLPYDAVIPELDPNMQTIEYIPPSLPTQNAIFFLFLIDTALEMADLAGLKESLIESLDLLPENAHVGIITYGKMVHVHELGYPHCSKTYIFRGDIEYSAEKMKDMLGLNSLAFRPPHMGSASINPFSRYFLPIQEQEEITKAIRNIMPDSWMTTQPRRPDRCTGVALQLAIGLTENVAQNVCGRVMLFTGGAVTEGPGKVVSTDLKNHIRSHQDIEQEYPTLVKKAITFYQNLAKRAVKNGHVVDLFASSLDQVGAYEMKSLPGMTGGQIVINDEFTSRVFSHSLHAMFDTIEDTTHMRMAFNGIIQVFTSNELKVTGLIGHASSLGNKTLNVSDVSTGIGGTNSWKACALDSTSTYGIFFEPVNQTMVSTPRKAVIQYHFRYLHYSGETRIRVTTIALPVVTEVSHTHFDQETAAVLMARCAVFKTIESTVSDALRWVDRTLIRLCSYMATFCPNDASSFWLPPPARMYPQYMFYLRRSPLLQVFNSSPDETCFYRHVMNTVDVRDSAIIIQPTLDSFGADDEDPLPVLLDANSISDDTILVLDTFFHIVIYHGKKVATWRKQGYQEQEGFEYFKIWLERPRHHAKALFYKRLPCPRFIDCDAGGSQARFLVAKVNPSNVQTSNSGSFTAGTKTHSQPIFTDDVSLQTFIDHLAKLVVTHNQ